MRAFASAAAALSLAACSGQNITGLDQALYNATYLGAATFQGTIPAVGTLAPAPTFRLSMTLSQLGQNFTGTFFLTDSTGKQVYSGSVTGKTTNTGADFSFVVPDPCPGVLYGSFTVSDAELFGKADGRDCNATGGGSNVGITFGNLVRQ